MNPFEPLDRKGSCCVEIEVWQREDIKNPSAANGIGCPGALKITVAPVRVLTVSELI